MGRWAAEISAAFFIAHGRLLRIPVGKRDIRTFAGFLCIYVAGRLFPGAGSPNAEAGV
jgi:hypothetical protein